MALILQWNIDMVQSLIMLVGRIPSTIVTHSNSLPTLTEPGYTCMYMYNIRGKTDEPPIKLITLHAIY